MTKSKKKKKTLERELFNMSEEITQDAA
jgi:hypothetical protein